VDADDESEFGGCEMRVSFGVGLSIALIFFLGIALLMVLNYRK